LRRGTDNLNKACPKPAKNKQKYLKINKNNERNNRKTTKSGKNEEKNEDKNKTNQRTLKKISEKQQGRTKLEIICPSICDCK